MAKAKAKTKATSKKKKTATELVASNPALDRALAQIEKQYGEGSIMTMDGMKNLVIEGIPTGALSLDIALGGKGVPKGRIVEIYGPESSGKTTLALHTIAGAQSQGGVAAFIDAEHALDTTWAKKLGVDVSSLLISQPDTGEQALDIAEMLVKSNAVDVIVVDSVAALIPAAEMNGDIGDSHVGLQARLMSQAMRKLTGVISKSKTCLIFINQIRMKIGVMFGNPETTPGGNALKFYSSVRMDVRRVSTMKDSEGNPIGNRVRVKVVKNKVAPPFQKTEFDIMFNSGISSIGDLLDLGVECDVVNKSGAWFNYDKIRLGQGRENAKTFLSENKELCDEIKGKIQIAKGLINESESAKTAKSDKAKS